MENELLEPVDGPLTLSNIKIENPEVATLLERFIELDKKKNEVKDFFDKYFQAVTDVKQIAKLGFHFQDDEGTVYQLDEMQWKNVRITPYEVKRTRREGERQGSLSLTKARDLGYKVEGE
jgi:hypothetical protein